MKLTGLILAGGSARRMGGFPKGKLSLGESSPLNDIVELFKRTLNRVMIARRADQSWSVPDGVEVVEDRGSGAGPLRGIYSALDHANGPVLVVAWDQVGLTEPMIRTLREEFEPSSTGEVWLYASNERVQPFPAVYHVDLKEPLDAYLRDGNRSVVNFLQTRALAVVRFSELSWTCPQERFRDIDRWSDYYRELEA